MRHEHVVQDIVNRDLRFVHLPALAFCLGLSGVGKAGRLRALNGFR
jgi:hypothetical protein